MKYFLGNLKVLILDIIRGASKSSKSTTPRFFRKIYTF